MYTNKRMSSLKEDKFVNIPNSEKQMDKTPIVILPPTTTSKEKVDRLDRKVADAKRKHKLKSTNTENHISPSNRLERIYSLLKQNHAMTNNRSKSASPVNSPSSNAKIKKNSHSSKKRLSLASIGNTVAENNPRLARASKSLSKPKIVNQSSRKTVSMKETQMGNIKSKDPKSSSVQDKKYDNDTSFFDAERQSQSESQFESQSQFQSQSQVFEMQDTLDVSSHSQSSKQDSPTPKQKSKNLLFTKNILNPDSIVSNAVSPKKVIKSSQVEIPDSTSSLSQVQSQSPSTSQAEEKKPQLSQQPEKKLKIQTDCNVSPSDPDSPQIHMADISDILSSPIKQTPKSKKVAFSSDIESSPISSSPIKWGKEPKSILKTCEASLQVKLATFDDMLNRDLSLDESWPSGYVLQVPENYKRTREVVISCVKGLKNHNFTKHYEVFATLNDILKKNSKTVGLSTYLDPECTSDILKAVIEDLKLLIQDLKNSTNPFRARTSSQAIKLSNMIMLHSSESEKGNEIYRLVVKILLNENVSKGLASSILQLFRDQNIPHRADFVESAICSIVQMKYFMSTTIITEKMMILKKFINCVPAIASKCTYQIMSNILYCILNTDVPSYERILNSCILVLTELARNSESKIVVSKLLNEELTTNCASIRSSLELSLKPWMSIGQAVCETLKYLIHIKLSVQAIKIWSMLLYLDVYHRGSFGLESWNQFNLWRDVFDQVLANKATLPLAVDSWKSVVYNFQISTFSDDIDKISMKFDLLVSLFEDTKYSWSQFDPYLMLYCRTYSAIRDHLDQKNNRHASICIKAVFRPFMKLRNWDSKLNWVINILFNFNLKTLNGPAALALSPEDCYWMSNIDHWKKRITPLPKEIYISEFATICKIVKHFADISIQSAVQFLNICIYKPLAQLNGSIPESAYLNFGKHIKILIISIFETYNPAILISKKEDAEIFFSLIENIDPEFLFAIDKQTLLREIFNRIYSTKEYGFVCEFVNLLKMKFDNGKLFAACFTSKLFNNGELLLKDNEFPQYLHYSFDFNQLMDSENTDLLNTDENIFGGQFIRMVEAYFESSAKRKNLNEKFSMVTDFIKGSNIVLWVDNEANSEVFQNLCSRFAKTGDSFKDFYEMIPCCMFKSTLDALDEDETLEFLASLPQCELINDDWLHFTVIKILNILKPEMELPQNFKEFLNIINKKLKSEDNERLLKGLEAVGLEKSVSSKFNDEANEEEEMDTDNMDIEIPDTQVIDSSLDRNSSDKDDTTRSFAKTFNTDNCAQLSENNDTSLNLHHEKTDVPTNETSRDRRIRLRLEKKLEESSKEKVSIEKSHLLEDKSKTTKDKKSKKAIQTKKSLSTPLKRILNSTAELDKDKESPGKRRKLIIKSPKSMREELVKKELQLKVKLNPSTESETIKNNADIKQTESMQPQYVENESEKTQEKKDVKDETSKVGSSRNEEEGAEEEKDLVNNETENKNEETVKHYVSNNVTDVEEQTKNTIQDATAIPLEPQKREEQNNKLKAGSEQRSKTENASLTSSESKSSENKPRKKSLTPPTFRHVPYAYSGYYGYPPYMGIATYPMVIPFHQEDNGTNIVASLGSHQDHSDPDSMAPHPGAPPQSFGFYPTLYPIDNNPTCDDSNIVELNDLLKKINRNPIQINEDMKNEVEKELLALLMKFKQ